MTKIIGNSLKLVLPHLISSRRSTFVLGKLITNNVMSTFELIHFLRKRRYGRNEFMALKLDMSKAYDMMEWPFVMGFPLYWQHMVYDCMSTAHFAFCVNGTIQGQVILSRGIRQGCSFSPYIFLLCANAFSSLIKSAEVERSLVGLRCS